MGGENERMRHERGARELEATTYVRDRSTARHDTYGGRSHLLENFIVAMRTSSGSLPSRVYYEEDCYRGQAAQEKIMPVEPDYSRVAGVHDPEAGDEDFVDTYPTSFLGNDKGRRNMFSRSYMWRRRISYGVTGTIFLLAGLALSYHFGSSRGHVGKLLIFDWSHWLWGL